MNTELYSFVKQALEKGLKREKIRSALKEAKWKGDEIDNALSAFAEVDFPVAVPRPKPYLSARQAFLYLISFIALYITAFSLGTLLFQFINDAYPDLAARGRHFSVSSIRTSLASIIVAFPLYLFLMRLLKKAEKRDPEQRQSKIRKWLAYLTLVIAAGIIIGDLIAVLSGFLGGELSIRFALKALTIFTITGSIFVYYLKDLRREEKEL